MNKIAYLLIGHLYLGKVLLDLETVLTLMENKLEKFVIVKENFFLHHY